jgi:hypothetical protein
MGRRALTLASFEPVALGAVSKMGAQSKIPYPAALNRHLTPDRNAEVILARGAVADSISQDARMLVLDRHGCETAVESKNSFVCVVEG